MSETEFKCSKCGYCCRTLFAYFGVVIMGLSLTKNETCLFDKKYIFPHMAIGTKEPTEVIMYQLALAKCPHLNEKNECLIYEKRPLACQCYPVDANPMSISVSEDCPQAVLLKGESYVTEAQVKKNEYIFNAYRRFPDKNFKMWFFDLATRKWLLADKIKKYF